jgi:hypothetical protein
VVGQGPASGFRSSVDTDMLLLSASGLVPSADGYAAGLREHFPMSPLDG